MHQFVKQYDYFVQIYNENTTMDVEDFRTQDHDFLNKTILKLQSQTDDNVIARRRRHNTSSCRTPRTETWSFTPRGHLIHLNRRSRASMQLDGAGLSLWSSSEACRLMTLAIACISARRGSIRLTA